MAWVVCACVLLWTRRFAMEFAIAAAISLVIAVLLRTQLIVSAPKRGRRVTNAGLGLMAAALVLSVFVQRHFNLIQNHWREFSARQDGQVAAAVGERLQHVTRTSMLEATRAAAAVASATTTKGQFAALERVRKTTRQIDALALFSESGTLVAWSGNHEGRLPPEIRTAPRSVFFSERPLFRYLYVTARVPGTTLHVVAAVLMETSLIQDPVGLGVGAALRSATGVDVSLHAPNEATTQRIIYTLVSQRDTILNAYYNAPRQSAVRRAAEQTPRRMLIVLVLLAYGALWYGWHRSRFVSNEDALRSAPLVALAPLMGLAPFGSAFAAGNGVAPSTVVPTWITGDPLAVALAVLLPICAFLLSLGSVSPRWPRGPIARLSLSAAVLAFLYAVTTRWALQNITQTFIGNEAELWIPFQLGLVIGLSGVTVLLLQWAGSDRDRDRISASFLAAGILSSLLLALLVIAKFDPNRASQDGTMAALWLIPFILFASGLPSTSGRSRSLLRASCACALAGSALLPFLWRGDVRAHIVTASHDIAKLGTPPDAHLESLLEKFSVVASRRGATGDEGIHLLYRTWLESGLAREAYGAQLTLWSGPDSIVAVVGPSTNSDDHEQLIIRNLVASAQRSGTRATSVFEDQPHLSRVLAVPIVNKQVVAVVIPPRRAIAPSYGAEFFPGDVVEATNRIDLVAVTSTTPPANGITWRRRPGGLLSEAVVHYPDGAYHAHVLIPTPSLGLLVARGVLLLALDLFVLVLLWCVGVIGRGRSLVALESWRTWARTLQSRVTIALFVFFLIPTLLFGLFAYRALAGEVQKTTQVVAQEAAVRGAADFNMSAPNLPQLAHDTRSDILRYLGGELLDSSTPGALELGAYSAWIPAQIYLQFSEGEHSSATDLLKLGGSRLVTAYHTTKPSGVLAVPMLFYSSDVITRGTGFAHLVLFATLIGAGLCLALSIAVGRTLTRPINQLTHAASAIGRGRLNIRLPEDDRGEFGELFRSFNAMVKKLRRARSRELQSVRVLAWGEMAQQVAHEIKNPLTPMKLSIQHVRRSFFDRNPRFADVLNGSVDQILTEIDHLDRIAQAFSRYGGPDDDAAPIVAASLASLVHETLALYRSGHEGTEYREEIPDALPAVLTRPGEFKEVLLNLLENAREAATRHGVIRISAFQDGATIVVEVSDDGAGIAPELLHRVFDPHFSTRSSGTGLGLAIVRRLVESWGGTISLHSERDVGTTVTIHLATANV